MLRELETVSGEGKVYRQGEFVHPVRYRIRVLQRMHTIKTFDRTPSQLAGLKDITGRIAADEAVLFDMVRQKEAPFTLHLEDGRCLDFLLASTDGTIVNANGKGLYAEA